MRIIYFKKDEKHVLSRAGENGATRIAALVGNISNTAYKLLPSGLRALLDKYRG